jgi:hypothetical protein
MKIRIIAPNYPWHNDVIKIQKDKYNYLDSIHDQVYDYIDRTYDTFPQYEVVEENEIQD